MAVGGNDNSVRAAAYVLVSTGIMGKVLPSRGKSFSPIATPKRELGCAKEWRTRLQDLATSGKCLQAEKFPNCDQSVQLFRPIPSRFGHQGAFDVANPLIGKVNGE